MTQDKAKNKSKPKPKPKTPQEAKLELVKNSVIVVATPCYGGMVTEAYSQSMFNLVSTSFQYQFALGYTTIANESLVTRARNELVATFLTNKKATHLMFIDADIRFDPKSIVRMIAADKDVVVGAYPLKTLEWEKVAEASSRGPLTYSEAIKQATNYVINVQQPDKEMVGKTVDVQVVEGLIEVWDAGTGFMLIKREVLEKMVEAYPETLYYSDKDMTASLETRKRWALFDTMIDEDKRYLSEDYTFCRRWQKLGGKIHLDVNTVLDHIGTYTFKGRSIVNPK